MVSASLVLVLLSALFSFEGAVAKDELLLVHIIFRHGDRTNDPAALYPTDPWLNYTYYPTGLGQLTNRGKLREFNLGKSFRKRYNSFLGDVLTPDTLEARSTDYNRTKASLELFLAGAFPPKKSQVWNEDLPWQPIPYNYVPLAEDKLMFGIANPKYTAASNAYLASPGPQAVFSKYRKLFKTLSDISGLNITNFSGGALLWFCLTAEQENGLALPDWSKKYFPDVLEPMAVQGYVYATGTLELKRFASGALIKKIVDDSLSKIAGGLPDDRKLYIYSGHEINVGYFLTTLNLFDNQVPFYGSNIIVEVHRIDGVYGIKLFHDASLGKGPQLLTLDGCDSFCPIDKFISLVQQYFPVSDS